MPPLAVLAAPIIMAHLQVARYCIVGWVVMIMATSAVSTAASLGLDSSECGTAFYKPNLSNADSKYLWRSKRIVGGGAAAANSWPWMVELVKAGASPSENEHWCGATLIARQWVVTAAHCVRNYLMDDLPPLTVDELLLFAKNNQSLGRGGIQLPIDRIVEHARYADDNQKHDMALIRLTRPFDFDETLRPACLPQNAPRVGASCIAIGWGWYSLERRMADWLKQARLPIVDREQCTEKDETYFCAGYVKELGRSSCRGDSGGGFFCQRPDGRWQLQGVTSFGDSEFCSINETATGYYADVFYFRQWLQETIDSHSDITTTSVDSGRGLTSANASHPPPRTQHRTTAHTALPPAHSYVSSASSAALHCTIGYVAVAAHLRLLLL